MEYDLSEVPADAQTAEQQAQCEHMDRFARRSNTVVAATTPAGACGRSPAKIVEEREKTMALMLAKLYTALREAGVDDAKAREAAEESTIYQLSTIGVTALSAARVITMQHRTGAGRYRSRK
jgi:hypothetical protein